MSAELPRHGGDLALAAARYGTPAAGWLDLSTGINPHPYPLPILTPECFTRLPQPADLADLEEIARAFYGVPGRAGIAAVAGSESAIRVLPSLLPPGDVAIAAPTYRSHADAWAIAGRRVAARPFESPPAASVTIAVLVNPNNPDGRVLAQPNVRHLAETMAARSGILVIDEAYADADPGMSAVALAADLPVIILRSFGKFFGLPGLRLGFVIGPQVLIGRLRQLIGDWPVSGPALVAGRAALADHAWAEASRRRIATDQQRLADLLRRNGLNAIGSAGLFTLVEDLRAAPIHNALARRGVWTRAFAERPDWLRLGLPRSDQFSRLEEAVAAVTR